MIVKSRALFVMIEAAQVRAARALIDWSQSKLAEAAGVPLLHR